MDYEGSVRGIIDETVRDKIKCDAYKPENIIYIEADVTEDNDLIIKKLKCQITEPHRCICNCEPM